MEIATKEDFNPIKQDVKKGALRCQILLAIFLPTFRADTLHMVIFPLTMERMAFFFMGVMDTLIWC